MALDLNTSPKINNDLSKRHVDAVLDGRASACPCCLCRSLSASRIAGEEGVGRVLMIFFSSCVLSSQLSRTAAHTSAAGLRYL